MRITYRQLQVYLLHLHPEQLDCDVTVEFDGEAYAADFRIVDEENDVGLDPNHPVVYVPKGDPERISNEEFAAHIEDVRKENGFGPLGE